MKKLVYVLVLGIAIWGCKSEKKEDLFQIEKFTIDQSGSIISMDIEEQVEIDPKSFSDKDWGIYKYHIDGLVGRLVEVDTLDDGTIDYIPLLSFKDVNKLPKIEELEEGEIVSQIIEKSGIRPTKPVFQV